MAYNQADISYDAIAILRDTALALPPGTTTRAHALRAVESLQSWVGGEPLPVEAIDETLLSNYVSYLLYLGYTPKTIINNHLKRLSSLLGRAWSTGSAESTGSTGSAGMSAHSAYWCLSQSTQRPSQPPGHQHLITHNSDLSPTQAIATMIAELAAMDHATGLALPYTVVTERLQALARADFAGNRIRALARDMLLMAVYLGGLTLDELATLRIDTYRGDDPAIRNVIDRYARPRHSYLFPLDQTHSTPRQLQRRVAALIGQALADARLSTPAAPASTLPLELWAAVAMGLGASAAQVAACISPRQGACPLTALARPMATTPGGTCGQLRHRVIEALTTDPEQWYAMHLRPRATYDQVVERLRREHCQLPETYYPMEEITRKVGHRRVFEHRPVIAWLIFFRERASRLTTIYRHIGDLAWGYRTGRQTGAPYATIAPAHIHRYRLALGTLGPDTEFRPGGATHPEPRPGDRVEIIGGLLSGHTATIAATIAPAPGCEIARSSDTATGEHTPTIYRLLLDGGGSIEWTAHVDARLVHPLPTYPTV